MSYRQIIQILISFIAYTVIQVVFLRNLVVFNYAFLFIYIGFLLSLPFEINRMLSLGIGLVFGLIIDIFYDSMGIHAAACVLIMFLRPFWLSLITPQGGYDLGATPSLTDNGITWFLSYSLPLVFIHQFTIFYIEAGGFSMFFFTLVKVIYSVFFTSLILVLIQFLFYQRSRRRT